MTTTTPSQTQPPPHDLDAEAALLGAMLLSRDAIAAAVETCRAEDFYRPAHLHIFEAICSLYAQGEPADPVTVAAELRRADLLEATGGIAELIGLQANTPSLGSAGRYAQIVRELSARRQLMAAAGLVASAAQSGKGLADALWALSEAAEGAEGEPSFRARRMVGAGEAMLADQPPPDWALPGLEVGETGLLAGAGGAGKSWWVLQVGAGVAGGLPWMFPGAAPTKPGRVAILTAEDGEKRLKRRLRTVGRYLETGDPAVASEIAATVQDQIEFYPFSFDLVQNSYGTFAPSLTALRMINDFKTSDDWRLIIVDPLAAFSPAAETDPNAAEATNRVLADLAKATGAAVLVSHHTSQNARHSHDFSTTAARGITQLADRRRWVGVFGLAWAPEQWEMAGLPKNERKYWLRLHLDKLTDMDGSDDIIYRRLPGGVLEPAEPPAALADADVGAEVPTRSVPRKPRARRSAAARAQSVWQIGGPDA